MRLTQKQEDFIVQYYKTGNATQAAIMAGYSSVSAHDIACKNLKKPYISARLEELRASVSDKEVLTTEERKKLLSKLAKQTKRQPDPVQAISELNKMDGAYAPDKTPSQVIYSFNFILPDGTRFIPGKPLELKSGQENEEGDV